MRAYEGLFLVDEGRASEAPQEVVDHIRELLTRHGAKIEKLDKWDTCRLAYEIDGKKRGTYFLSHFEADPARIVELRRDCELSNTLLRAMVLRREEVGQTLEAAERARRASRGVEGGAEPEAGPEGAEAGGVDDVGAPEDADNGNA